MINLFLPYTSKSLPFCILFLPRRIIILKKHFFYGKKIVFLIQKKGFFEIIYDRA